MIIIPDIVAIRNSGGQFIAIHYDQNFVHYGLMSWQVDTNQPVSKSLNYQVN